MRKFALLSAVCLVAMSSTAIAATRWEGYATVNYNNTSSNCTGSNLGVVSSNAGNSVGVSVLTNQNSSFVYVLDMPYIALSNGQISSIYGRHYIFTLGGSGSVGAIMPGIALANPSWSGNANFSGSNLVYNISVSFTANGTSCVLNYSGTAVDAGG